MFSRLMSLSMPGVKEEVVSSPCSDDDDDASLKLSDSDANNPRTLILGGLFVWEKEKENLAKGGSDKRKGK